MRRTFTRIDALVIVAVLGVASCLLLPALRAAQLQARSTGCFNNLRQMGLALHNYHQIFGTLPMSAVAGQGHGQGHSCFLMMLPAMEQNRIYNAYNTGVENWHVANSTVVALRITTYLCPDNPNTEPVPAARIRTIDGQSYPGTSRFARTHYGANWGGGRAGWGADFEETNGTFRGVMMTVRNWGPEGETTCIRLRDIRDGAGFTVAVGEKRDSLGWDVGGWAGSEFDPHTSPVYDGTDPRALRVYTGSPHDGLAHVLLCDGTVRRLRGTMDRKVWYALLTRDGGEPLEGDDF